MEYEPIDFTFTKEERKIAIKEGYRRQRIDEKLNLKGRNGGPATGKKSELLNLIGAAGEMAVASHLGLKDQLYKEKLPVRGSYDLPPDIDVKTTQKHINDLIVQLDDVKTKRYVLVTIENKKCMIHGWITSERAMRPIHIKDPKGGRPAYFVPKGLLEPISTLIL